MKYHWKDIDDSGKNWVGLAMAVELRDEKPQMYLQSGNNTRIRLMNHEQPVFWATICDYYSGVWLLKSYVDWKKECMPISPITSQDIEQAKGLEGIEKLKHWSKYFARQLQNNQTSFLYEGLWLFAGFVLQDETSWSYKSLCDPEHFACCNVYDSIQPIRQEQLIWIDWGIDGSGGLFSLKHLHSAEDGRIKWWRKKAKEQLLPPILAWYLTCLDAYIIVDGHDRLVASILENIPFDLIVVYSAYEIQNVRDPKIQERLIQYVASEITLTRKNHLSIERLNQILIRAFDNRPFINTRTVSTASIELETQWEEEVCSCLISSNLLQKGQAMLNREKKESNR